MPRSFVTAATLAAALNAQLFLMCVLSLPVDLPPAGHTHPDNLDSVLADVSRAQLQRLMDRHPGVHLALPW